jgi:hypothetical protein
MAAEFVDQWDEGRGICAMMGTCYTMQDLPSLSNDQVIHKFLSEPFPAFGFMSLGKNGLKIVDNI